MRSIIILFLVPNTNMQYIEHMTQRNQTELEEPQSSVLLQRTQKKPIPSRDDRFLRSLQDRQTDKFESEKTRSKSSVQGSPYEKYLSQNMFWHQNKSPRKFTIKKTFVSSRGNLELKLKILRNEDIAPFRKFKVVGWKDNYYTNLLDWSYNNFVCAGYLTDLCLYNMAINDQFESSLYRKFSIGVAGEFLTSLKCSPSQTKISLGYSNGSFKIFDYFKEKSVFNGCLHHQRIGTIEWSSDTILTGSKDQSLKFFDPRSKKPFELPTQIQRMHSQQICGIRQRGRYFSTGGNDNKVNIYDFRKLKIIDSYSHCAAVKAMSWIGDKKLVTGGGTADKRLKFWDETEGVYKEVDTGSQVCSLCWSAPTKEIISCQGFSLNQIIIWNHVGQRQFTFHGHSSRVLYSSLSPSGQLLASGAGDQSLKIWKLFPNQEKEQALLNQQIR